LLAIDPMHIWYSQEARMYAALTCFAAIGVYLAIRLLRRATWLDWLGYALAMALTIYFDYIGIAVWIAVLIVITIGATWHRAWTRAKLLTWLSAQVIVALSLLPLWPNLQRTLTVYPQGEALRILIDKTLESIPRSIAIGGLVAGAIGLGLIVALGVQAARRRESHAFVAAAVKLAIVIGYALWLIAGGLPRLYTIKRQIVMFAPCLILASAFVFDSMFNVPVRARRASAYALIAIAIGGSILNISVWPKEDWRGVAALVAQESIAGDMIINSPGWYTLPFGYYCQMHPGAPGRMVE
jgi:mannosyltransferase